jgi:hypothetical protein
MSGASLLAAPAAAVSADSAARVPEEPAAPVRGRLVPVRQPVPADRLAVLVPVHLAALVHRPVPADPLLAQRPVLAHLVLELAVPVERLLSRQSSSAAMARSTP